MDTASKILALAAVIFLLILFFRAQGAFVRAVAMHLTSGLVWNIVRLVVAGATGYVVYICITFLGLLNRIKSIDDIFLVLSSRPSQIGGSALLGAIIGGIFALFTLVHWAPAQPETAQGRVVRFETLTRRITVIGVLRGFIRRRMK